MRRILMLLMISLLLTVPARAGGGAGELSLDRSAVLMLLRSATPERVEVEIPGLGFLELELEPPGMVEFVDGGIEGRWHVELPLVEYGSAVAVRLVPRLDPLSGTIGLEAEWATPEVLPPGAVDLAPLLPVLELPRALRGPIPGAADPASRVTLHVQDLELMEERLVIRFGLVTRNP